MLTLNQANESTKINKNNKLLILVFGRDFADILVLVFFFTVFGVKFHKYFFLGRFGSKIVRRASYFR